MRELFPCELIKESLGKNVKTAEASVPTDNIHILNSIQDYTGDEINNNPPTTNEVYEAGNNAIKAAFVSLVTSLRAASKGDDATWGAFLEALSKLHAFALGKLGRNNRRTMGMDSLSFKNNINYKLTRSRQPSKKCYQNLIRHDR